ncbi:hypothetical protein N7528_008049 [Penicillium herquei]|nr:hypothetical protein N7528_008049 [Penicillium herquei]
MRSSVASSNRLIDHATNLLHDLRIPCPGAYITERNVDLGFFLTNYETEKKRVHAALPALWRYGRRRSEGDPEKIPLSIATTWELSLNLLFGTSEVKDAKTKLLVISAFFGRTNITEDLFKTYSNSTPKEATPTWMNFFIHPDTQEVDLYTFRETIADMGRLCLLQSYVINAQGVTWQFHPVVQDWAQIRQGTKELENLALLALRILKCSMDDYETGSILVPRYRAENYQRLRPHVEACYTNCRQALLEERNYFMDPGLLSATFRVANFFSFDRRYELAKEIQRRVIDLSTPGSLEYKRARWNLASTLIRTLEQSDAAKILEEAVLKQVEGSEDVEDAFQILELSSIYRTQALNPRQFPDAGKTIQNSLDLSIKALEILRRLRGDTTLEVASALEDLASAEYHGGNLSRALELGKEVLSVGTSILGAEASSTLNAKNHLAVTYA